MSGADARRSRFVLGRLIDRHTDLISAMATDIGNLRKELDAHRKECESAHKGRIADRDEHWEALKRLTEWIRRLDRTVGVIEQRGFWRRIVRWLRR